MSIKKIIFAMTCPFLGGVFSLSALELSENHPPVIIKPEAASPAESYAAEELAEYLGKVLGFPVEIATGTVPKGNKVPVILGRHPANADLSGELKGEEQAIVEVLPDRIRIAGGYRVGAGTEKEPQHDRGSLYGAYDLLEEIGVRWYRPEEWGEYVPSLPVIHLEEGRRSSQPVYRYRYGANLYQTFTPFPSQISSAEERDFFEKERDMVRRWAVRNRHNTNLSDKKEYGGRYQVNFAHAYNYLVPKNKYLKSNPEYFALINGVRSSDPNAQLCVSNKEVEDIVFNAILETFKANPNLEIASIDPNDLSLWCECDGCRALDDPELKAGHSGKMPEKLKGISMANRVVDFGNRIARRLEEVHPDKRVGWYAYHVHTEVPTKIDRLESNVAIMPVAFAGSYSDYTRGLYDPASRQNSAFLKILQGYKKLAEESNTPLLAHDYWSGYAWPGPLPVMHSMADKLRHYHKDFGIVGVYNEVHPNWGPQGMILYFYTWLLRNPEGDLKAEVERYYRNYYGPAAEAMKHYHETLEEAAWGGPYFGSGGSGIETLFTWDLIQQLQGFAETARKDTGDQIPYRQRLDGTLAGLEYAWMVFDFHELKSEAQPKAAMEMLQELKDYYYSFKDGSVFDNRVSVRGSMENFYFSKYISQVEKEAKLLAFFIEPKVEQIHNEGWRFQTDADDKGEEKGWHQKDAPDSGWPRIHANGTWQSQGYPDYQGVVWYRRDFKPPVIEEGHRMFVYFEAVDGSAAVYLNGQLMGTHNLEAETYKGWDEPFYFDITDSVNPDVLNQLTVRVKKDKFVGGITGTVRILSAKALRPPE